MSRKLWDDISKMLEKVGNELQKYLNQHLGTRVNKLESKDDVPEQNLSGVSRWDSGREQQSDSSATVRASRANYISQSIQQIVRVKALWNMKRV